MPEKDDLQIQFSGLWDSANPYSKAPPGAMEQADECIIRDPSLLEPRRGYSLSDANPSGANLRLYPWSGYVLSYAADGSLRAWSSGSRWNSAYNGTYSPPDSTNPVRFASAGKTLFFTTSSGVKALDSTGGVIEGAGMPVAPYILATTDIPGSGTGFLPNGYQVSYCVVLCKYDANNQLIQGSPSAVSTITNGLGVGAIGRVAVTPFPVDLQGATFTQLYRTKTNSSTPDAEFYLVQEYTFAAADITNNGFTFDDDNTPDSFLTAPLYTNANTGDGTGVANDLPPLARDLCASDTRLLYLNTTSKHSFDLQLFGTGNIVTGVTTLRVGNLTVTADTIEDDVQAHFRVFTTGTAAQNIENTARSLAHVITYCSRAAGVPYDAVYSSGPTDAPGMITIYEGGIGGSGFTVTAENGFPNTVPDMSGVNTRLKSDNNRQPAALWWSNDGQPWGVNLDNYVIVGDATKALLRGVNVRQVTFLFKEDGLWRMDGFDANGLPVITPFDPSCVLTAPESIRVVNNTIFALTRKGDVAISESGVTPAVSKPIERTLCALVAAAPQYTTQAFGVPYEDEGLAILAMPDSPSDTYAGLQYVFNASNPSWTRWLLPHPSHGIYNPATRSLVWAVGSYLYLERVTFTSADYNDPTGAINSAVKFLPFAAGDPLIDKRYLETYWDFRNMEASSAQVGFDTDRPNTTVYVPITGPAWYPWGTFAWGLVPWGQSSHDFIARANMPQGMAQASRLRVSLLIGQAGCWWQLQGLKIRFEATTNTLRR